MNDAEFLRKAIELSQESANSGGFPAGAVVVRNNEIISVGQSGGVVSKDPTGHAEITAIRNVCEELDSDTLADVTLYSSLEPCLMCLSAAAWALVPRVVYACGRDKVPKEHYEGAHNIENIIQQFRMPIEIVHSNDLEEKALSVIRDWKVGK